LMLSTPMMSGDDVLKVQRALATRLPGVQLEADGIFGPDTDRAVRQFQTQQGFRVDGIVGPATSAALDL